MTGWLGRNGGMREPNGRRIGQVGRRYSLTSSGGNLTEPYRLAGLYTGKGAACQRRSAPYRPSSYRQSARVWQNWCGFLRCATPTRRGRKCAMTLDQLRFSVDETRARIDDKIGDVLDDDRDCASEQDVESLLML